MLNVSDIDMIYYRRPPMLCCLHGRLCSSSLDPHTPTPCLSPTRWTTYKRCCHFPHVQTTRRRRHTTVSSTPRTALSTTSAAINTISPTPTCIQAPVPPPPSYPLPAQLHSTMRPSTNSRSILLVGRRSWRLSTRRSRNNETFPSAVFSSAIKASENHN